MGVDSSANSAIDDGCCGDFFEWLTLCYKYGPYFSSYLRVRTLQHLCMYYMLITFMVRNDNYLVYWNKLLWKYYINLM